MKNTGSCLTALKGTEAVLFVREAFLSPHAPSHGPRGKQGPEKSWVCLKVTGQGRGRQHALVRKCSPLQRWKLMKLHVRIDVERHTNDPLGRTTPGKGNLGPKLRADSSKSV